MSPVIYAAVGFFAGFAVGVAAALIVLLERLDRIAEELLEIEERLGGKA